MSYKTPPSFVNAGTHKKVFYRVVERESISEFEGACEKLANLINDCNGRVYGTMVMQRLSVLFSFEIPTVHVTQFIKSEAE